MGGGRIGGIINSVIKLDMQIYWRVIMKDWLDVHWESWELCGYTATISDMAVVSLSSLVTATSLTS